MRSVFGANPFDDELFEILHDGVRVEVVRGDTLYNHGERESALYLVESGQVNALAHSIDGKRCLLDVCMRGDIVGELGLLGLERQETALAVEDSVLRKVQASQLASLSESSRMLDCFVQHLLARLVEQQRIVIDMVTLDSEHRLAATLLRMASRRGTRTRSGTMLSVRLTHEDLASMVGTTRSRIGFFLKGFRKSGLVTSLPGSFLMVDENGLSTFIGIEAGPVPMSGYPRDEPISIPSPRVGRGCDLGPGTVSFPSAALHGTGARRHAHPCGREQGSGWPLDVVDRDALRTLRVPRWIR